MVRAQSLLLAGLLASACGGSLTPPSAIPPATPGGSPNVAAIVLGQTVTGTVNMSDPPCDTHFLTDAPDPCQQFTITLATSGTLRVHVTSPGPGTLALRVGETRTYGITTVDGSARVNAGATYELSVALHYGNPASQTFELSTTMDPGSSTQPFTVSGVVTEYRGGPLANVTVLARPNFPPGSGVKTTLTDATGSYRIGGLTESIIIDVSKDGYEPTGFGAFTGDRVLNLTMSRRLAIAAGQTLNATIWGDSVLSGEDWTGANCDHKACAMIRVTATAPGKLTARLNWGGQGSELGVFISTGFFGGQGAYGASPLAASLEVRGGETLVIVSFEKSGGVLPQRQASQAFELATAFTAR